MPVFNIEIAVEVWIPIMYTFETTRPKFPSDDFQYFEITVVSAVAAASVIDLNKSQFVQR